MLILETAIFTRQVLAAKNDEEYREFQLRLVENPELGKLIPKTGGLRKVRWEAEGRGKRGGYRVIYYWAVNPEVIVMLAMFAKNERADLNEEQKRVLRRIVEEQFAKAARH
ncbi:MAG TPA: type II toxin-antitoxin system RelE/ParE family toxin [Longimicrobium sp.]|nr:type II toxin-antitoxin system RelE/ParE family toxin [Longimicrobium sp.]